MNLKNPELKFTIYSKDTNGEKHQQEIITSFSNHKIKTVILPSASIGNNYEAEIKSTSETPCTWRWFSGDNMPRGIYISPKGKIFGVPISTGSHQFTLRVTDINGSNHDLRFLLNIEGLPEIKVKSKKLPDASLGNSYGAKLELANNIPCTWSWAGGNHLPTGMYVFPKGEIFGVPLFAGSYNFILKAVNLYGAAFTKTFTLFVKGEDNYEMNFANDIEKSVNADETFHIVLTPPFGKRLGENSQWFLLNGELPEGVTIDSRVGGGTLSGNTSQVGQHIFTIGIKDENGNVFSKKLILKVRAKIEIITNFLENATVGKEYEAKLDATGNSITWTISEKYKNSFPQGLYIHQDGTIAGTPAQPGNYNFYIRAIDVYGDYVEKWLKLKVEGWDITTDDLPDGVIGEHYKAKLLGTEDSLTWIIHEKHRRNLPHGIYVYQNGEISGIPEAPGRYNFYVQAIDIYGNYIDKWLTLYIEGWSITTETLPDAAVGEEYRENLTATDTSLTLTWKLHQNYRNNFPNGIKISKNGEVTGIPTTAGSYNFLIRATDTFGNNLDKWLTLKILAADDYVTW